MHQKQTNVINKSEIQQALHLKGCFGKMVASLVMKALHLDKVNYIHNKYRKYKGPDFAEKVLREVGVKYDIDLSQLDHIPQEGAFITISNHNYGSIDGMMLAAVIGHIRPDFKILTNFLLARIPALQDTFFPVNPFTSGDVAANRKSFAGLKLAVSHVASGGCLGLFPAGEVATTKGPAYKRFERKDTVQDIPWPSNMIKLIRNAGVPVVPVYFDGTNSRMFHILGKIHPRLRTIKLVGEMFNKKGRIVPMRIGKPISPSELEEYSSLEDLGGYLRSRVYGMQQEFVRQYRRTPTKEEIRLVEQIALPRDKKAIMKELDRIKSKMLFSVLTYQCYLADYEDIPNIILELGRLREDAFRSVGEGTNLARDIDDYDKYYKHLILWDTKQKKIAGAYRIGVGSEIMKDHGGVKGFYTASLFDYKVGAEELLPYCIELGRSFVNREYQKESISLMLLFKGLMHSMLLFPQARYFLGPVSMSNDIPRFYKSLIVYYLTNLKPCTYPKRIAAPTCPFITDYINIKPEDLLRRKVDNIEKFDRFLLTLSDGKYRMPTLVKKYFKCNAQLICFNVDPAFNYSLDGLILLPLDNFPKGELLPLLKSTASYEEKETLLNRYGYSMKD